MLHIYNFIFSKSAFDLNEDYDRLSDVDKERIDDMEPESFIEYEEDGKYSFFIIAEPTDIEKYSRILNENLISHESRKISDEVLKNTFNIEDYISKFSKDNNFSHIKYQFFIDDLNEWIYNNLDIDTILDRISSVGIQSLTKNEKEFLKNYNL